MFDILLLFTYHTFACIWSIIGYVMFDDYYGQACQDVEKYRYWMQIAFITGFVSFSFVNSFIIGFFCYLCRKRRKQMKEIERLLGESPELFKNER